MPPSLRPRRFRAILFALCFFDPTSDRFCFGTDFFGYLRRLFALLM